uniref:Receptor L-domain domain-containing protein n=1 Tax=Caenorhabditis japonica TaxID=281687 RepID=A0A8R1DF82_CAEJA
MSRVDYDSTSPPQRPIDIYNNNVLENLTFGNLSIIDSQFYIGNNLKLNAVPFCEQYGHLAPIVTSTNLKNCDGCVGGKISEATVKEFQNCTSIQSSYNYVTDIFLNYGTDMSPLKSIQIVRGYLEMYFTDATDMSFFENVKMISSNGDNSFDLNIHGNDNMTRFGMTSLETLVSTRGFFKINIELINSEFCLTTKEMDVFMKNNVQFGQLQAKYCENETRQGLCRFDSMPTLANGCVGIVGDVKIESGDEIHVAKLSNVTNIYGSLLIQNTSLVDFKFLANLQYITLLNGIGTSVGLIFENRYYVLYGESTRWKQYRKPFFVITIIYVPLVCLPSFLIIPEQEHARKVVFEVMKL